MKKIKNKKGFTLIELIVVIAILAVLGLLLVPQISGFIEQSKVSVGHANAKGCYSQQVAKLATEQAGLKDTSVTIEDNCSAVTADGVIVSATWDGGTSAGSWTYTASTGEVVKN